MDTRNWRKKQENKHNKDSTDNGKILLQNSKAAQIVQEFTVARTNAILIKNAPD